MSIKVNKTTTTLRLAAGGAQGPKGADSGISYQSVSGLRQAAVPTGGTEVTTRGYAANGDGGGGRWWYDATSTDAHDGGLVVRPNGIASDALPGRYIRLRERNTVDPAWYGAVAGTDAAYSTANTAAWKAAAAAALAHDAVLVADGQHYIDASATSPLNILCHADLRRCEILYSATSGGKIAILVGPDTYSATLNNKLTNKAIEFGAITNLGKTLGTGVWGDDTALKVTNTADSHLSAISIRYAGTGLWMSAKGGTGTVNNTFDLPLIMTCRVSQLNMPEDAASWVNENRFYGGHFIIGSNETRSMSSLTYTLTASGVAGAATGGTFVLTYSGTGGGTATIPYNATVAQMDAAVNSMAGIIAVGGATVGGTDGGPWTVSVPGGRSTLAFTANFSGMTPAPSTANVYALGYNYTPISGTCYIKQSNDRSGGQQLSHNRWYGPNIEGGIVEWKIDTSGVYHRWYDLRCESQHADPDNPVMFRHDGSGAATRNTVILGFSTENITWYETGNSRYNQVLTNDNITLVGESTGNRGLVTLATYQTGGSLLRVVQAADVAGLAAAGVTSTVGVPLASDATLANRWGYDLQLLYTRFKSVLGAFARFRITHTDGRLDWGPGTSDTYDTNLYRASAGVLATDSTFRVGTLNPTTALTVGANGSGIKQIYRSYVGITNLTIGANSFADTDITLAGVAQGDVFHITTQSRPSGNITWEWFVVGADTWSIRLINLTSSPITVNSITFWYLWFDMT